MPAKITAEAKRKAIGEAFGDLPGLDWTCLDWFYRRRHLAKVDDGGHLELAYIVEYDELDAVIGMTLDRIRERDGKKIFKEVTKRLIDHIEHAVERADGKWDHHLRLVADDAANG